jgi:hypothetical protein
VDPGRYGSIPFEPTSTLSEVHGKRLAFWVKEIPACCDELGCVALSVEQAKQLYTRPDGSWPLGAGRAMAELVRLRECEPLEQYRAGAQSSSMVGSVVNAVLSPFRWALGGAGDAPEEIKDDKQVFVLRAAVERVARRVLSELERHSAVFSETELEECVRRHTGDRQQDADLVLHWLRERRSVVVPVTPTVSSRQKLCKLSDAVVSELDVTIYQLRTVASALQKEEDELERRSRALRAEAQESVRAGSRARAAALLKRKHIVDDALSKRLDIGTNVALVLARVETAQADHMALAALQQGSAALKAAHVEPEEVSRLLDEFSDLQAVQDDVSDAFAANANSDMEELEKELAALALEEPTRAQPAAAKAEQQPAAVATAAPPQQQQKQQQHSVKKKLGLVTE